MVDQYFKRKASIGNFSKLYFDLNFMKYFQHKLFSLYFDNYFQNKDYISYFVTYYIQTFLDVQMF